MNSQGTYLITPNEFQFIYDHLNNLVMSKNVIKTSVQFKTWLAEHSFSQVISLLDMMGHALAQDAYGRPPDLLRNYVKPKGLNSSKMKI